MAPRKNIDAGKLRGVQKAAVVMMSVEEEVASKIFAMMNEDEIKEISQTMASLGSVEPNTIETLMEEFSNQLSEGVGVVGDLQSTQKLLTKVLGAEKVASLMEDMSGPAGRNTWDKLNNVGEEMLAAFLKNEYPQTAALVLTKVRTAHAARIISVLPQDFAIDVIQRMITIEPVKREVLADIESTLQSEFMSNISAHQETDSFGMIAEIFNNFDRSTEAKFMEMLDKNDPDSAIKIKELMFTFDDLINIDGAGIQAIIKSADKEKLAVALKGASDQIRELFFSNMSERAAKLMKEDMEAKGPVRMKDVDAAQMEIVNKAKELAEKGEIVIPEGEEKEEEMVY